MSEKITYSEHFYQKSSNDTDVLVKNAHEYPFSSLAGFLLLYHYKKIGHPDFHKLARKIVLLFNNPHWLQFQLFNGGVKKTEEDPVIQEPSSGEPAVAGEIDNSLSEINFGENAPEENDRASETANETDIQQADDITESGEVTGVNNFFPAPGLIDSEISPIEENIAFEPLHTVDYFASQGIKINDELVTNDKLGSQMKSFTEWLRSMKKLHPGRLPEQNIAAEKLIQSAAEVSNVNTEVLTEAMAEVLIKQDKKEKAIEMFSKLSLINPSKSAYFAARIESIKSS